jgi:hypothetical protein
MLSAEEAVRAMWEDGDPDLIVPDCVIRVDGREVILHPVIAQMRNAVLARRQVERLDYCDAHNIDGDRWEGCHGCDGTGWHLTNHLPCWCDMGRIRQGQINAAERVETERIRQFLADLKANKHPEAQAA